MANVNITSQENEITQIKLKNNAQYYLTDTAARTAVSNIQVSLSTARSATSLSETTLASGDSFETAIGKLHTGLGTTEQVVEAGLNDLDERLGNLEGYAGQYLTFTALRDTTFAFSRNDLQYSLDNGTTWTTLTAGTSTPTVTAGNKILWKQTELTPEQYYGIGTFSATGNFEASGNIMSLYYGDNFIGQTDLTGKTYAFYELFKGNTKLINAENLILPATALVNNCYSYMFNGCTALTTAPKLPATTLAERCYGNMFDGCTVLTTAPELHATTLAESCYSSMFNGCTALTTAPELPATTLASNCYSNMFNGCTALTTAPELHATTLVNRCYSNMFNGCTALTTAPELPASSLATYCYSYMFYGCTTLTTAPELSATTLANGCYSAMFQGCSSLTTAPELPATTLTQQCYYGMFNGCTSLNYIKCLATDISASSCTSNWVSNVASTGIFVKADGMTSWTTGVSGIPSGWTVYTDDEYKDVKKYELSALEESIDAEFESTASILDVHNRKITALETALGDVETILQSI